MESALPKSCGISECVRPYYARGFCQTHLVRLRKHGDANYQGGSHAPPEERFKRFFVAGDPSECWNWFGAGSNKTGYGSFQDRPRGFPSVTAHRFSYRMYVGEIADGLMVLHSCDNRRCVNPSHLRLGTHLENMADMSARNRRFLKLTPEIVREVRQSTEKTSVLARKFNLSESAVRRARLGLTWGHIT